LDYSDICSNMQQYDEKIKNDINFIHNNITFTMEPITASICFFVMTGGMIGVAMYEHNKIIRYIEVAKKRQEIIDKLRKDLIKGK